MREHEPMMALDGTGDGLKFYRRIAKEAGAWLKPGGAVYLEIGYDQGKTVSELLSEAGFDKVRVVKDLPRGLRHLAGLTDTENQSRLQRRETAADRIRKQYRYEHI